MALLHHKTKADVQIIAMIIIINLKPNAEAFNFTIFCVIIKVSGLSRNFIQFQLKRNQ